MPLIGDYIKIKHGYAFKGDNITTDDNNVVLVTPGNFSIGGGFKEQKCKFFNAEYPEEYILQEDDLIVTMTDLSKEIDTLGFSALVPYSDKRIYLHNQRIGLVQFLRDDIDKHYLYWYMRTPKYQKTVAVTSSGSTVHHTSPARICEIEIDVPVMEVQKKVAGLLDKIESKISINNAINRNLEEQAQALYEEKFAGIFSAEATNSLSDIAKFSNGKKRPQNIGNYAVYGGNGILAYADSYNNENCVIIGRVGAYCGCCYFSRDKCWISDNAICGKSTIEKAEYFLYYVLKNARLSSMHIGSGQPLMTQGILNTVKIKLPAKKDIIEFSTIVNSMYEEIDKNYKENIKLAQLRDTLLPKLMSGELDVSEIDI